MMAPVKRGPWGSSFLTFLSLTLALSEVACPPCLGSEVAPPAPGLADASTDTLADIAFDAEQARDYPRAAQAYGLLAERYASPPKPLGLEYAYRRDVCLAASDNERTREGAFRSLLDLSDLALERSQAGGAAQEPGEAEAYLCLAMETKRAAVTLILGGLTPGGVTNPLNEARRLLSQADTLLPRCQATDRRYRVLEAQAHLARQESDTSAYLKALYTLGDYFAALPPGPERDALKGGALWNRFYLLELRFDLGDLTDGGQAMERFLATLDPKVDEPLLLWTVHMNLGSIQRDLGFHKAARAHLDAARTFATGDGFTAERALIEAGEIRLLIKEGSISDARQRLTQLQASHEGAALLRDAPRRALMIDRLWGDLLLAEGKPRGAEARFQAILNHGAAEGENRWRARLGLARVKQMQGDLAGELAISKEAIDELEAQRLAVGADLWPLAHITQRESIYLHWIDALLRAYQGKLARAGSSSKAGAETKAPSVTEDDILAAVELTSSHLLTLRVRREAGQAGWMGPAGKGLKGEMPSGATLRSAIPEALTVLIYQPLPDRLLLLEVDRGGVAVHDLPLPGPELFALAKDAKIAATRLTLSEGQSDLARAGEMLLGPVRHRLGQDGQIAFVLKGDLERLPVASLKIGGQYLVEQSIPTRLPNLRILSLLSPAKAPTAGLLVRQEGALAAGDGLLASLTVSLPESREIPTPSSSGALFSTMKGAPLVHISSHGQGASLSASSSLLSPLKHGSIPLSGNNWLSTGDILALGAPHTLVFLGICEGIKGLGVFQEVDYGSVGWAFLATGTRSVIAAQRQVGEGATHRLESLFYAKLRDEGPARALALAQREMIRSSTLLDAASGESCDLTRPSTHACVSPSAPGSWSGFSLTGMGTWEETP